MIFYINQRSVPVAFTSVTFYILTDNDTSNLGNALYTATSTTNFYTHLLNRSLLPLAGIYYVFAIQLDSNGFSHEVGPTPFEFDVGNNAEYYIPIDRIERPILSITNNLPVVNDNSITISTSTIKPSQFHTETMYTIMDQYKKVVYFDVSSTDLNSLNLTIANEPKLANVTELDIRVSHGSNGVFSPVAQYKTNGNNVRPVIDKLLIGVVPGIVFEPNYTGNYTLLRYELYEQFNLIYNDNAIANVITIPADKLDYNRSYRLITYASSDGTYETLGTVVKFEYNIQTLDSHSIINNNPYYTYNNTYESVVYDSIGLSESDIVSVNGHAMISGSGSLTTNKSVVILLTTIDPDTVFAIDSNHVMVRTGTTYELYLARQYALLQLIGTVSSTVPITAMSDTNLGLRIINGYLEEIDLITGISTQILLLSATSYKIFDIDQTTYLISVILNGNTVNYFYYSSTKTIDVAAIVPDLTNHSGVRGPDGVRFIDRATGNISIYKNNIYTPDILTLPVPEVILSVARTESSTIIVQTGTGTFLYS